LVWLNSGIAIAEVAISKEQIEDPIQIHILCGDAYHELARIHSHKGNTLQMKELARRGIEHIMEVITAFDSVDLRYKLIKMYMFLLQAEPNNSHKLIEIFDSATAMLIAGCRMDKNRVGRCSQIAEELFEFAIKIIANKDNSLSERMAISALSLYPFLKKPELINKAHLLKDSIDETELPDDIRERFIELKELMDNLKPKGIEE
ncbi:hypothetical protein DRQ29_04770, partial [bacterium]